MKLKFLSPIKLAMKKNEKVIKVILLLIASFLQILAIDFYYGENIFINNSIVGIFLFTIFFMLGKRASVVKNKLAQKYALIAGVVMAVVAILGLSIYRNNDLEQVIGSLDNIKNSVAYIMGFLIFFYSVLCIFFDYISKNDVLPIKNKNNMFLTDSKKSFFIVWGVIFLLYLPCYLAHYPGVFSYDIAIQMRYVMEGVYSTHHPIIHSLMAGFFMNLGMQMNSMSTGLMLYTIFQMLVMSAIFSLVIFKMAKLKINIVVRVLVFLFFVLHPFNAVFSLLTAKDVLFTGMFIILTLFLIDIYRDEKTFFSSKLRIFSLILTLVFFCLFRNNGIYAVILMSIFMVIFLKKYRAQMTCVFLLAFIFYFFINGFIFSKFLSTESGNIGEALCVPLQQVSKVVKENSKDLEYEEKAMIDEVLPYDQLANIYNPRNGDWIKSEFNNGVFERNPIRYGSLWLKLLVKNPRIYLESFLSLNMGYWYYDATYRDEFSKRDMIETNIYDVYGLSRKSFFPNLLKLYDEVVLDNPAQAIPVLSSLFSISTPIWFVFICVLICCVKGQSKKILIFLPAIVYWVTLLAGPLSNFRYIYPLFACIPIYITISLQPIRPPMKDLSRDEG